MYADVFPMFVNTGVKIEFFETIIIRYIEIGIINIGNNMRKSPYPLTNKNKTTP